MNCYSGISAGTIQYNDTREASVTKELPCQHKNGNSADIFTVAVVKQGVAVGHY